MMSSERNTETYHLKYWWLFQDQKLITEADTEL